MLLNERKQKLWNDEKVKMKIYVSPNQKLIEFVFIGIFVCGKVSWVEEIN